jgi:hypothetical protein
MFGPLTGPLCECPSAPANDDHRPYNRSRQRITMTSNPPPETKKAGNEMNQMPVPVTPANVSPVFSIAGATPGASQAAWKTAYPNPDTLVAAPRPAGHGPTFTIAGVVQGTPDNGWRTAMPDPTRDTLDPYGHVISKVEAAARAELAARRVLAIEAARKLAA